MMGLLIFTAPLLLLIIIGILIRARGNPAISGRCYFLFLVWTSIGSLALILLNWMFPLSVFSFAMVLFPIVPGLIVLTFFHRDAWGSLSVRAKVSILSAIVLLAILTVVQIVMLGRKSDGMQSEPILFGTVLLTITTYLFISWKWKNRHPFLLGTLAILYLALFNALEIGSLSLPFESPGWQLALGLLAYLTIPSFVIPVMASLSANILGVFSADHKTRTVVRPPIIAGLFFILILLGYLLYTFFWLWLWDGIDDGIRGLLMIGTSVMTAISAGLVMVMTLSVWRRWMGLVFAILVIVPLYLAVISGMGMEGSVSNYTITEERATRIQQALDDHEQTTGSYPASLHELVPEEMWRVPLPMIMPEQNWCYEAGPDFYRLGAVFREHWSSPYFSVRVYASAGDVPEAPWECDEKLAEAMAQSGILNSPLTPVPRPTSVASDQKIIVEPIVRAQSLALGGWSPDGMYLVFGLTEYFMEDVEHVTIDLRFLNIRTGEVCQPSRSEWTLRQSNGLYDHSVWLPDGRLLYVTDAGEMLAFTPCVDGAEDLASRYPVKFTHVMSSDKQGGRVLLKNEEAYWLLNGISLDVRKIAGIPAESYRPMYSWSPDGARLAISWMSGPEIENEAFLYIVDWTSADVTTSPPLEGVSDANLPIVEWLTRDELLLHGGKLTVLDFGSDPPTMTDVLRDIFLLDIAPNEISSTDTVRTEGGYYLGVQVDHPRNQGGYMYSSKTGQVQVFQQDVSTMIFFEDGQWMRLIKWEDEPLYRDEYLMVWMDKSHEDTILKIDGHVPRAHPQIFPRYLPVSSQVVIGSSQGISLVSLPDGKTVGFWDLSSDADYFSVVPSPNGEALIVESGGDGLYYIPIPPP